MDVTSADFVLKEMRITQLGYPKMARGKMSRQGDPGGPGGGAMGDRGAMGDLKSEK